MVTKLFTNQLPIYIYHEVIA